MKIFVSINKVNYKSDINTTGVCVCVCITKRLCFLMQIFPTSTYLFLCFEESFISVSA
jgi:hypothetical protein